MNVDVLFTSDGTLKPRKIITKDGTFTIDRILGIKRHCPQVVPCVAPYEYKVMVEGVQIVSKHVKPRRQGEAGGIIKTEGAIYASKVQLYCSKCGAGRRAKVVVKDSGEKIRVCVKCGEEL